MPSHDPSRLPTAEELCTALDAFGRVAQLVLIELADGPTDSRSVVIRNQVARATNSVRSIRQLWLAGNVQDGWMLHRCLVERLFHLWNLCDTDSFETFCDWAFHRRCKHVNDTRSDVDNAGVLEDTLFSLSSRETRRLRKLQKDPPIWHRPDPEKVARAKDMRFLYRYGYDYASNYVHPLDGDGEMDFFTLLGIQRHPPIPDQRTLLSNTLVVGVMIVREAMSEFPREFVRALFNLLDDFLEFLSSTSPVYNRRLAAILARGPDFALSRPLANDEAV